MAAGDFTATQLLKTIQKADSIWMDNRMKPQYTAEVEVVKALRAEQTARVEALNDPTKDRTVRVVWIDTCNETTAACTNDCTIGGAELESGAKDLTIAQCRTYGFNVKEKLFRGNEFDMDEAVAKGLLKADKVISEYIASRAVTFLGANDGTNTYNGAGTWTLNGTSGESDVAAANMNADLVPHLLLAGKLNRFANPFVISGTNLFVSNWKALINQGNADGKGDAASYNAIRKYFDVFNVDVVNSPDFKTYLVDQGAVAFAHKSYYPEMPVNYKTQDRFSFASRNLEGVRYDVVYTNECASNEIVHKYSVYAYFDYFLNPLGCTATNTGILTFKKV